MFFCRFPVVACPVYAVFCNMKYVGTNVFAAAFLSKKTYASYAFMPAVVRLMSVPAWLCF